MGRGGSTVAAKGAARSPRSAITAAQAPSKPSPYISVREAIEELDSVVKAQRPRRRAVAAPDWGKVHATLRSNEKEGGPPCSPASSPSPPRTRPRGPRRRTELGGFPANEATIFGLADLPVRGTARHNPPSVCSGTMSLSSSTACLLNPRLNSMAQTTFGREPPKPGMTNNEYSTVGYSSPCGEQALSTRSSAASWSFGGQSQRGQLASKMCISPGHVRAEKLGTYGAAPGAYEIKSSMGRQNLSSLESASSHSFGKLDSIRRRDLRREHQSRMAPGPGAYRV